MIIKRKHQEKCQKLSCQPNSWVEISVTPIIHITGPGMITFVDSFLKYDRWISIDLISIYCAFFALCISLLCIQFAYRYIAVCRPNQLDYFEGVKILLFFIPCVIFTFMWYAMVKLTSCPTREKELYFSTDLKLYYNESSYRVAFASVLYKSKDFDGNWKWNWDQLVGAMICDMIMATCFTLVTFFAFKTYRKLTSIGIKMSKKTKDLNKQLFLTLAFQTLLPTITMYAPVGLLFTLPIFEIDIGIVANQVGALLGIYPALDPLVAIFLIKDFRNSILCIKQRNVRVSFENHRSDTYTAREASGII